VDPHRPSQTLVDPRGPREEKIKSGKRKVEVEKRARRKKEKLHKVLAKLRLLLKSNSEGRRKKQ
jgi:hypothetical protein